MRILYLEDDEFMARSMLRYGALLGHDYLHVRTGVEARAAMADEHWDALIADEMLRNGELGSDTIAWAAQHCPTTIRILTSGTHCPPDFTERPPMQVFLAKPFNPKDLIRLLARDGL